MCRNWGMPDRVSSPPQKLPADCSRSLAYTQVPSLLSAVYENTHKTGAKSEPKVDVKQQLSVIQVAKMHMNVKLIPY